MIVLCTEGPSDWGMESLSSGRVKQGGNESSFEKSTVSYCGTVGYNNI